MVKPGFRKAIVVGIATISLFGSGLPTYAGQITFID